MTPPKFLYFDLGNVLLRFDFSVMCRQMGEVAGLAPQRVHEVLLNHPLQKDYERGRLSTREFYEAFCRDTGTRPDFGGLLRAASDIFALNAEMVPVVAQLYEGGHRLGILSNTCEGHFEHCLGRFRILDEFFEVHAVSYRIGAAKPEAAMYRAAAEMAGVAPEEVFFADDVPAHVAGAREAGFDAVEYTSTARLVAALWARGLRFNY